MKQDDANFFRSVDSFAFKVNSESHCAPRCIKLNAETYKELNAQMHSMDNAEEEGFVCITTPEVTCIPFPSILRLCLLYFVTLVCKIDERRI